VTLPPLPLDEWRPTKDTLHLWAQIIGKVRLANMPRRNHWWHAPLYVSVRGLTTGRIPVHNTSLEIELDLIDHEVHLTTRDAATGFALHHGLSVAEFYRDVMAALDELDVATAIKPEPYGVPMTTPFPDDDEHHAYDKDAVSRFHDVLTFADTALQEFAGWFSGKSSPVHVFWHSFDLAHTRFSGEPAHVAADADPVTAEAYAEEVISFGFWPGDDVTPAPTFYAYAAPEPAGLAEQPLRPAAASWFVQPSGATAHLPYEAVRQSDDPRGSVLQFFQSAYEAGADLDRWDVAALATSWAPPRPGDRDG
jgi:hypothetical protein